MLELRLEPPGVAVLLAARGVPVCGIELSAPVVERLRQNAGDSTTEEGRRLFRRSDARPAHAT